MRTLPFREFYLPKLYQVLTLNVREKSMGASSEEEERNYFETPEHSDLNKACPQDKYFT